MYLPGSTHAPGVSELKPRGLMCVCCGERVVLLYEECIIYSNAIDAHVSLPIPCHNLSFTWPVRMRAEALNDPHRRLESQNWPFKGWPWVELRAHIATTKKSLGRTLDIKNNNIYIYISTFQGGHSHPPCHLMPTRLNINFVARVKEKHQNVEGKIQTGTDWSDKIYILAIRRCGNCYINHFKKFLLKMMEVRACSNRYWF